MRTFVFISNIPPFLLEPLTEEEAGLVEGGKGSARHPMKKMNRDLAYERLHRLLAAHSSGLMLTMHVKGLPSSSSNNNENQREERSQELLSSSTSGRSLHNNNNNNDEEEKNPNNKKRCTDTGYGLALFASESEALEACRTTIYPDGKEGGRNDGVSSSSSHRHQDGGEGRDEHSFSPLLLRILKKERPPRLEEVYCPTITIEGQTVEKSSLADTRGLECAYRSLTVPKWCPATAQGKDCVFGTSCHKIHLAKYQTTVRKRPAMEGLFLMGRRRVPEGMPIRSLQQQQQGGGGGAESFQYSSHSSSRYAHPESKEEQGSAGGASSPSSSRNTATRRNGSGVKRERESGGGREMVKEEEEEETALGLSTHNVVAYEQEGEEAAAVDDEDDGHDEIYMNMSRDETKMLSMLLQHCIGLCVDNKKGSKAQNEDEEENGKMVGSSGPIRPPSFLNIPPTSTAMAVYHTLVPSSLRLQYIIEDTLEVFRRREQQQQQRRRKQQENEKEEEEEERERNKGEKETPESSSPPPPLLVHHLQGKGEYKSFVSPLSLPALPPLSPSHAHSPLTDKEENYSHPHYWCRVNEIHLLPSTIAIPLHPEEVDQWLLSPEQTHTHPTTASLLAKEVEARVAARIQAALPSSPAPSPSSSSSSLSFPPPPYLFFCRFSCAHGGAPWDWALHEETVGLPLLAQLCPYPPHGTPTPLERDILSQKIYFWLNQLNAFTTGEEACRALRSSPRVREAVRHQRRRDQQQQQMFTINRKRMKGRKSGKMGETVMCMAKGGKEHSSHDREGEEENKVSTPVWSIQLLPWLYLPTVASESCCFVEVRNERKKQEEAEEEEEQGGSSGGRRQAIKSSLDASSPSFPTNATRNHNNNNNNNNNNSWTRCDGLVQRRGELRLMTSEPILREGIIQGAAARRQQIYFPSPESIPPLPTGQPYGNINNTRSTITGQESTISVSCSYSRTLCSLSQYFVSVLNRTLDRVAVPQRGADLQAEHHLEDSLHWESKMFALAAEAFRRHLLTAHAKLGLKGAKEMKNWILQEEEAKYAAGIGSGDGGNNKNNNPNHNNTSSTEKEEKGEEQSGGAHHTDAHAGLHLTIPTTSAPLVVPTPTIALPETTAVTVNFAMYTPPLLSPLLLLHCARERISTFSTTSSGTMAFLSPLSFSSLTLKDKKENNKSNNNNTNEKSNNNHRGGEENHHAPNKVIMKIKEDEVEEEDAKSNHKHSEKVQKCQEFPILQSILSKASLYSASTATMGPAAGVGGGWSRTEEVEGHIAAGKEEFTLPVLPSGSPFVLSLDTYGSGMTKSFWLNKLYQSMCHPTAAEERSLGGGADTTTAVIPDMWWNTTKHAYDPLFSVEELKKLKIQKK